MASKSNPEIWVLLDRGIKPRELIAAGYKYRTVYKINARFKKEIRLKANAIEVKIRNKRG